MKPRLHICGFVRSWLCQSDCATHGPVCPPFWKHYRYSAFFVASSRLNWLVFQHRGNNIWTEAVKPIFSLYPVTWSFRQWGHVDSSNHELTQFYSLCFLFIVWLEKHQSCVALNHGRKLEYYLCNYQGSFFSINRQKVGLITVWYPLFRPLHLASFCATYTFDAHFPSSRQTIESWFRQIKN